MRKRNRKVAGTLTLIFPYRAAIRSGERQGQVRGWPWASRLCAVVVGVAFLGSGILKLKSLPAFLIAIEGFRLAPYWLAPWLAVTLPWLELLSGLCVATGFWRKTGATLILGMLVAFTAAAIRAIMMGLDIECGCFGIEASSKVGMTLVGRNIALIVLTAVTLARSGNRSIH